MQVELKEKLRNGIVTFTYTKKDGTTRQAKGTLMQDRSIVGENFIAPKGTGAEKVGSIAYWDLDKDAWRACQDTAIVSIDNFIDRESLLGKSLF
jgi:hypothetical protein